MVSTFAGLNVMVSGLAAQQMALNTVGQNVSNASNTNYSRQTVALSASPELTVTGANGPMQLGTGVDVDSISRIRDTLTDQQYWQQASSQSYYEQVSTQLGTVQNVFNDSSGTGLSDVLNTFATDLQNLSTNAGDTSTRAEVLQQGQAVVSAVQQSYQDLTTQVSDINSAIGVDVQTINQLTTQIASFNQQISAVKAGGSGEANDLEDQRDAAVDQLAKYANINVATDPNNNFIVQVAGNTLVSGNNATQLATTTTVDKDYGYSVTNVVLAGTTQGVNASGGELAALTTSRDSTTSGVKGYLNKLSAVSQFLLKDFNGVQSAGYGLDNTTGVDFFGNANSSYTSNAGTTVTGDPTTWPSSWPAASSSASSPTAGSWIAALGVNSNMTGDSSGLNMIAASSTSWAQATSINQSNTSGGTATLSGVYTGGLASQSYSVNITGVSGGQVTSATYNGASLTVSQGSPSTIDLPDGLVLNVAQNASTAVGDTYNLSVPPDTAAGDNAVNLSNLITTTPSTTLGTSLNQFYQTMVGALGVQGQNAQNMSTAQEAVVAQITNLRQSTSGVNMDEEMTNMLMYQQGYDAAARVMTTLDAMLSTLISQVGGAG